MPKFSRDKGARVEREVAQALFDLTGITFQRNLEQSRAAEHGDLIADDPAWPFLLEVKARASGHACDPAWKAQAYRAALATGQFPAVVYKFDRRPIRCHVQIRAIVECTTRRKWSAPDDEWADITLEGLAYLAR